MPKLSCAQEPKSAYPKRYPKPKVLVFSIFAEVKAKQDAEAKAKSEAEAKAALTKKMSITCVKGKLSKKVTAVKPKCPAGYKKK